MSDTQLVLDSIRRFAPRDFGIEQIFYRSLSSNRLEIVFIVNEAKAGSLISYLNSLASLIGKEVKNIKIESSVYIDDKAKNISQMVRKDKLEKMELTRSFATAGA